MRRKTTLISDYIPIFSFFFSVRLFFSLVFFQGSVDGRRKKDGGVLPFPKAELL
jgi:hypothetical protein